MEVTDFNGDVTSVSFYMFNSSLFNEDHNRTTGAAGLDASKLIVMVSNVLLSVVIVGANSLTLLAECRTKSLKNIRNKYIVSLAVADFYVGLTYGAMVFQNYGKSIQAVDECRYYLGTLYSTLTVSLFSMLLVAVDRYVYIAHPFFYMRKVTERKINMLIVFKWAASYSFGISTTFATGAQACNPSYIFDNTMIGYGFPSFFLVVSVGIGITYGRTAMIAKKYVDRRNKRVVLMNKAVCKKKDSLQGCRKVDGERPSSTIQVVEDSLEDLVRQEVSYKPDAVIIKYGQCKQDALAILSEDEIKWQLEQQQNKAGCPNIQKTPEVDILFSCENGVTNDDIFTEMFDDFDDTTTKDSIEVRQKKTALATEYSMSSEMCDRSIDKIPSPVNPQIRTQMIAVNGCSKYLECRHGDQPESCNEKYEKGILETESCVQLKETQDLEMHCKLGIFCEQKSEPVDQQIGSRHHQGNLRDNHVKSDNQQGSRDSKSEPSLAETVPNPCSLASLRWMKQMVVVFGLFVVCWTPSMVYILMSLVYTPDIRLMYSLSVFGVANSGVNFFVYSSLNKGFRTAIKRRMRCHCKEDIMI